mmetsp:Transcript_34220/g.59877  ORF Transcript_34220/g.59877 Transcript_34220/m.59877 type:complete len:104 (+) Transcript_34220:461-772(+)|eukprot:CAMPEP_0204911618 /NCGR_PEP_ID=MMETSP1397-20131031/9919_1 /ASSEMBLY_ACC=CAM_ASM_000891 /TAXON_ID=49980 /ORGANISM="Climacostomum Climacostomum virens, Strain Stock W-24" /LENGTH=103 /DNA_ID=CAMNT_0052082229 /DNA_START=364 /DNA_END=675 /DNA_ORIENTATION=+
MKINKNNVLVLRQLHTLLDNFEKTIRVMRHHLEYLIRLQVKKRLNKLNLHYDDRQIKEFICAMTRAINSKATMNEEMLKEERFNAEKFKISGQSLMKVLNLRV